MITAVVSRLTSAIIMANLTCKVKLTNKNNLPGY